MSLSINSSPAPYQTTSTPPSPAMEAGFWKKTGDSISNFFSDIADSLQFGETYKLIRSEYQQIDHNGDQLLNQGEFMVGTLTLNPMEFRNADRNMDNHLSLKEYVTYRKDKLARAFAQKDVSGDHFVNHVEIGTVGRIYLQNRDPNVDANQDGLLSKREYMRAHLKLGISIRDMLGF